MIETEDYKKVLESMSKEELLNEISNLISDHGIQLQNKNIELQELKSALARADLQLQFQIGEVDLNNREIERLKKELANERNAVITFQESANAHRLKVGEVMKQNAELQKRVDELAYELAKKSIATEGINVTNTDISLCVHEKLLEQAVKDAVKEFAIELLETKMKIVNEYYIFADNIKVIAKQKGVEVE